jgi:hypothetical protein
MSHHQNADYDHKPVKTANKLQVRKKAYFWSENISTAFIKCGIN